jgi:hypothetical protein
VPYTRDIVKRPIHFVSAIALSLGCASPGAGTAERPASTETISVRRIAAPPGVVLERVCSPSGPELCFNAADDNCNGIIDEGCGVRTGLVQFAIAWADPLADVDLNVTDPGGELVEPGRATELGLTKDRDCPGRQNECHGQNSENVYLEDEKELPRGVYKARLRLERLGAEDPPIVVTFGARVGPKSYGTKVELTRPEEEAELVFEL